MVFGGMTDQMTNSKFLQNMKSIMKISIIFCLALLFVSCDRQEESISWADGENIALPVVESINLSFFNLTDLENAFTEFTLDVNGNADQIEVLVNFNGGDYSTLSVVTEFPTTLNITIGQIESILEINRDDLVPGDSFNFTFLTTVGASIYESGTIVNVKGACPSEIPEGTYLATSGGTSTDGCPPNNPLSDLEYEITLSSSGGGNYTISDFAAGVYQDWYGDCYGYTFETEGPIVDVCNTLTMSLTDRFGSAVVGSGSYNPSTGQITMNWENGFGDTGKWTIRILN